MPARRCLIGLLLLSVWSATGCDPTTSPPPGPPPTASATPEKLPGPPLVTADPSATTCRMAVAGGLFRLGSNVDEGVGGGFVELPSGRAGADPASLPVAADPASLGAGPIYDPPLQRWLPAPSVGWLSPDGTRFVVLEGASQDGARVRVVDAVTRATLAVTTDAGWSLVGWVGNGVVLQRGFGLRRAGLYRLDLDTGAVLTIVPGLTGLVTAGPGAVWSLPNLPTSGVSNPTLFRIDPVSGARTTWLDRPGHSVQLLGFDGAGLPLVAVDGTAEVVRVANQEQPLTGQPRFGFNGLYVAGRGRSWFLDLSSGGTVGRPSIDTVYSVAADDVVRVAGTFTDPIPAGDGRVLQVRNVASACV